MELIENKSFDMERALYGAQNIRAINCRFEGEADGESAFKESTNILAENCFFDLRYPFWHGKHITVFNSIMTEKCRAPIWYSENVEINELKLGGTKALRECKSIKIYDCQIASDEFGWDCDTIKIRTSQIRGEYFMRASKNLDMKEVMFDGKYSFQYLENGIIENCKLNTKDAFWHAKNVIVKNSVIKGEYLGWYSKNVTFEKCKIIGTQPLCYCKGLRLIDCEMYDCDLSFENSEVEATITTPIESIKNPKSGIIYVPIYNELIQDNKNRNVEIVTGG
jgi:hypothetical protein